MGLLKSLQLLNPRAEIWWDSSPLLLETWKQEMIASATKSLQRDCNEWLPAIDAPNYLNWSLRGATTNPTLCLQVIEHDLPRWTQTVDVIIHNNPHATISQVQWAVYKCIAEEGAALLHDVWDRSNAEYGWLSVQVDPRDAFNSRAMIEQALDLVSIAPNVMVKVPGSEEGYQTIEALTGMGVSTNNTLCFTTAQAERYFQAIECGLDRARSQHVDLSGWRSVITYMTGRFGDKGDLKSQAELMGIHITEADTRLSELLILKRIYQLIQQRSYPAKLLLSSMRITQYHDTTECIHMEKTAGADIVYTCPPPFIRELMENEHRMPAIETTTIDEVVGHDTQLKLMQIPYFVNSYDFNGIGVDEFSRHSAFTATLAEFCASSCRMDEFISSRFRARLTAHPESEGIANPGKVAALDECERIRE